MSKLALLGGEPVITGPLPLYNSIGPAEYRAVEQVLRSGCLSGFYGSWGDQFLGGPMVRTLEEAWCEKFRVRHSVSFNSATSGLFAAMGAIRISPGDEVIVPPYTMSATVVAPLLYGGIPVFADIDEETFCLDPESVRSVITDRTKAILAVNLFGHPAPLSALRSLAEERGLYLVEDNAQGPLAMENDRYAGTIGHVGVFSLNYHKHIHTGEGGVCVTNDDDLALRLQMIRNHAESVVEESGVEDITNLVGFNYRMTELSAAVGVEQLKSAEDHVEKRVRIARGLSQAVSGLSGLTAPAVRTSCRHVYYVWAFRYDEEVAGISRSLFSRALTAEGVPHFVGYVRPLYKLPVFRKRIAFGTQGYPFTLGSTTYHDGLCPVCERMHEKELVCFETCLYDVSDKDLALIAEAIVKVSEQRERLALAEKAGDV
jgi:perosamine synthetase